MGLLRPDKSGLAMTNGVRNKLYFSEQPRVSEGEVDCTVAEKRTLFTWLHVLGGASWEL